MIYCHLKRLGEKKASKQLPHIYSNKTKIEGRKEGRRRKKKKKEEKEKKERKK